MKEKICINIPIKYREILSDWSEFFAYESEDSENGKLVVFSLYTDSKEFFGLETFLKEHNVPNYIFRREYTFTKKEKENSEILWLWTDDDAKDSYTPNPTSYICKKCNRKIPLIDRHMLHVDYKKIKKCDIMSTYNGDIETIVSEKVKQLFTRENITGVKYEPIYQLGKENMIIEGYYHLILQEGIGEIIEPSIINKSGYCSECGHYDVYVTQTILNFHRITWDGLDICYSKNWLGGPPKFKNMIISNKLFKVLQQNKLKYVYFQPANLVD